MHTRIPGVSRDASARRGAAAGGHHHRTNIPAVPRKAAILPRPVQRRAAAPDQRGDVSTRWSKARPLEASPRPAPRRAPSRTATWPSRPGCGCTTPSTGCRTAVLPPRSGSRPVSGPGAQGRVPAAAAPSAAVPRGRRRDGARRRAAAAPTGCAGLSAEGSLPSRGSPVAVRAVCSRPHTGLACSSRTSSTSLEYRTVGDAQPAHGRQDPGRQVARQPVPVVAGDQRELQRHPGEADRCGEGGAVQRSRGLINERAFIN